MENLVNSLDECRDGEVALEIIRQISQFFDSLTESDLSKIDQHLAFAFPEEGGILDYLSTKNAAFKNADKAREQGFQLILSLLQNPAVSKQTLQPYCLRFKKTADLARKNQKERARIQAIALDCLQTILVQFGPTLGAVELDANNLYWEILRDSEKCSFQPTVRGKMFHTLGIIAKLFSTGFMDKPSTYNQLFNHLVASMKDQIVSKNHHMEAAILLGTVKGMDEFLSAFEAKITQTANPRMMVLYEQLEQVIDPKCSIEHDKATLKLKRREFQRAGLDLIANHGSIFQEQLYKYYEQWFWDLLSWAKSNNMDDLRAGMRALSKFIKVICSFINEKKLEEDSAAADGSASTSASAAASFREKLINFFTTTFRVILDNKDCHKSELSISIEGIGLLVHVCDDAELKEHLFAKILKHVEIIISEFNMPERDKYSRGFSMIPSYLDSLGNMLMSMQISDEGSLLTFQSRLAVIEQLCAFLVAHYPDMGLKYKEICPYSFLKVLRSLYTAHFRWAQPFLENIVAEGLRELISCRTQVEIGILIEAYQRANAGQVQGPGGANPEKQKKAVATKLGLKTLHSFLPFWIKLVQVGSNSNSEGNGKVVIPVGEFIYDAVIQWALLTIARLDLSIEFVEEEDDVEPMVAAAAEETSVHPMYNTKANTARDFQLFVNLVEFLQEFMTQTPPHYFERRWVEIFLNTMLKYVNSHPYVSGFYKLVALGFDMMRKIGYFNNMALSGVDPDPVVTSVFQSSSDLLKSLGSGVQEHRDDLLLSVLGIWLSAPDQLVLANLEGLEITLRIIFQTGRTCFPIAMQGASALERWFEMKEFPIESVEKLFNELFPIWKSYFTTSAAEPENSESALALSKTIAGAAAGKKPTRRKGYRRRMRDAGSELKDTTLNALQLRILQLIGSYGHFLDVDADINGGSRKGKMSTEEKFLKYAVPFQDIKPDLYLDSILPRVLELCAEGGSERQVRSSACECFHSLALYFLGHSVNSTTRESHSELFSKIFTAILKLGSDSDSVVRQLFNPLAIQVIHWYTRKESRQPEVEIILRTIMDSLAQSEDSPLRDFAGVAISEFFSWSLKHGDMKKVEMITKTLSAMSTHAAPKYRQGSVLAFNSIYREFRENDKLVNAYTFLFTYSYLVSLGLPSEFGGESILIKSTRQGLRHLERIILKKKTQFNIPLNERKLPAEFGGGQCLVDLVDWMMGHCVKAETIGRDEVLRLVSTLAPNIKNMGSLEAYLFKYQEGKDLVSTFENFQTLDLDQGWLSFESFQLLLKSLIVATDLYEFFASSGSGGTSFVSQFLKSPNSKFIEAADRLLNSNPDFITKSPTLSFRFFIKLGGILQNSGSELFNSKFRGDFLRSSMQLSEFVSSTRETNLVKLAEIYSSLFPSFQLESSEIKGEIVSVFNLNSTNEMDVAMMAQLCKTLEWFQILAASKFLHKLLSPVEIEGINERIWKFIESKLFDPVKGEMRKIGLRMEELVQNLLIFALEIGIRGQKIVDAAFDPGQVISKGTGNVLQKLKKGEVFQRALLPALCHCQELLDFKALTDSVSIEQIGLLAQSLLNTVKNQRGLRKKFGTRLVESTLLIWRQLHLNCDPQIIAKIISGLASLNMEMCRNSVQLSEWWGGNKMMTSTHLTLAEKAEFVHFFPLFALSRNSSIVDIVVGSMEEFVKSCAHFDPRPNVAGVPTVKWSQEENYFLNFFLKLTAVYEEIPQNLKLLEILVRFTTKAYKLSEIEVQTETAEAEKPKTGIKENPCASQLRKTLEKVVESNNEGANENISIAMANCALKMILNERDLDCGAATKFALIPILASMTERSAQRFYLENIRVIIKLTERPASTLTELKVKTTGFCMVEMLALKTSKKFLRGSILSPAYLEQLKKEGETTSVTAKNENDIAVKVILGSCSAMRKVPIPAQRDGNLKAAHFSCHASAFNALCAILKAGEFEVPHFSAFVFTDKLGTGALPGGSWSNLVDSTVTYTFPVILDAGVKKISTEKTSTRTGTNAQEQEKTAHGQILATLPESSLASDASKYDFTSAVKVGTNEFYRLLHAGGPLGGGIAPYTDPKQFLEWNAVNEHECMLALIQTIRHMQTFKFEGNLPGWAKELVAQLERQNVHANVKAFLIGAILNCEEVIQPYAQYYVEPVIATILKNCFPTSGSANLDPAGPSESLNHFVKDIIVMLLSWLEKEPGAMPKKSSAKQLMEFYIKRIEFSRNDVFQHNLQILQAMVKGWVYSAEADGLTPIPYEMIEERLDRSDQRVGLHICQAILLGGQLPCTIEKLPAFVDKVSRGFKSTIKSVYTLAGEVGGLMLKYLDGIQYGFLEEAMVRFKDKKLGKEKGRVQPFLAMLNATATHFPSFLLKFKTELIGMVSTVGANLQPTVIALLVQVLRVELANESQDSAAKEKLASALFADLEGRGVFRSECKESSSGVDFLNLLISTDFVKNEAKVKVLVNWTQSAEQSADGALRARYASAISTIYIHYGGHKPGSEISSKTEKMFVRLYPDQDPAVREVVNEFWSKNLRSWTKSPALILELMETLGDDANALPVALDLILKRCSQSPDFGKLIFDKALADCPFIPYQVDTSWRLQNFSYQPLFAESLSSLAAAGGGMGGTMLPPALQSTLTQRKVSTQFGMNLLRATLNQYQFTPTQGNNSLEEQSFQPMDIDDSFDSNRFPSQNAFEVPAVPEAGPSVAAPPRALETLRRRFYERPEAHVFARRANERQQIATQTRIEDNRQKRSGVRMVRSYRIGELPDILIRHSEFLLTISTLAKLDEELGKIFLVRLFTAIAQELGSGGDARALNTFRHNAGITFDKLFRTYGSQLSPKFAGAMLEISLANQIRVKVNLVSNISRAFELQVLGILKLEEEQESSRLRAAHQQQQQESKKPRLDPRAEEGSSGSRSEAGIDVWLRIGELYKELDDFDTVRSVFFHIREMGEVDSRSYYEKAREALYYESLGKHRDALERYDDVYTQESGKPDPNILLVQFWDDAIYKNLASLADWSERYRKAHESYKLHEDELHNENYRDRVLPNQIVSGLQVLLNDEDGDENIQNFNGFLEIFRKNDDEWKELVETYRVEIGILSQIEEEPLGRTSALVDSAWASALRAFQFYDRLSSPQRKAQILELQKIAVLSETTDWGKATTGEIEDRTSKLINKWRRSCSSTPTTTSLLSADFIITQKNHFLTKAVNRLDDTSELMSDLQNLYFEQNLWVVHVAALNGNAEVGNGYLKKAKEAGENLRAKQLLLLSQLLTSCEYTQKKWAEQWTVVWKRIPRLKLVDPFILWKAQSELLKSVIVTAERNPLDEESVDRLSHALSIPTGENLLKAVTLKSIELVGKATGEEPGFPTTIWDKLEGENVSMTFFHLLKTIVEKFPRTYGGDEGIHKRLLLCLIQGMKTGHSEALHYFPTCFPWLEQFPSLIATFEAHTREIPCWMFLPWLDQIVTNYRHNPKLSAWLKPILENRLVPDYPQAFQLQYTEFLSSSPLMVSYGKALGALVLPDILFKRRIQNLEGKHTPLMLKTELEKLWQDLEKIRVEPEFYGRIHQDYVNEVQPKVKDRLADLEKSGDESNASQAMLICQQVSTEISTLFRSSITLKKNVYEPLNKKALKSHLNLKDLSPWLSKFHFAGFNEDLEIPGLFKHFKKPNPSQHSKIVSFEPTVQVYSSLTKPIGLRMMANDGKKYQFLVKYGDDLRQDKRIQQLFDLTNEVLGKDPHCRQRALSLMTYSVIPISRELGLIEIVGKTLVLKKFIFNTSARQETYLNSKNAYEAWINSCSGQQVNLYHQYGRAAMKERSQVVPQFNKVIATVPPKLFRSNVQCSTETPESYFQVRTTLIRSYATMSLTHWLLGIGDRHLDNCLISLERGEFLGIDFGMAFGAGAVSIDVPELIPFRLTPQLQEFLTPYGTHGLFKETMMFAWRTILKSAGVITAVAEVFVKEPTVTWARKGSGGGTQGSTLPIDVLKQKLGGGNPIMILGKLLQQQRNKNYVGNWIKVAEDGRGENTLKEKLSDEELIDLLLGLASDKNVLGRAYIGWSPWV